MKLIYQAYGGQTYRNQAAFSLLSSLHYGTAPQDIVVYTDDTTTIERYGVHCRFLSRAVLLKWRGRFDFVHRLKLEVLRDAIRRHPAESGWVIMDADTQWRDSPKHIEAALRAGRGVMHLPEEPLGARFHAAEHQAMQRAVPGYSGMRMLNAGVIGVPGPAEKAEAAVTRMIELTDRLVSRCLARNWLEQTAVSWVMQQEYQVSFAGEAVLHYWNYNREVNVILSEFFAAHADKPREELSRLAAEVDLLPRAKQLHHDSRMARGKLSERWAKVKRSWAKRKIDMRVLLARLTG